TSRSMRLSCMVGHARRCTRRAHQLTALCTTSGRDRGQTFKRPHKFAPDTDGFLTLIRLRLLELPTTVRSMEEPKDESRQSVSCRVAQWCYLLFMVVCLTLHTVDAGAAGPRRHFDLDAG